MPARAIIVSSEAVKNNTGTSIAWALSSTAPETAPQEYEVVVVGHSDVTLSRETIGPVRGHVVKTQPGEDYNITMISTNVIGQTVAEPFVLKVASAGIMAT